jgi:hypothetical protein
LEKKVHQIISSLHNVWWRRRSKLLLREQA